MIRVRHVVTCPIDVFFCCFMSKVGREDVLIISVFSRLGPFPEGFRQVKD